MESIPYRPVFSLPELKTVPKHLCFVPVQIPVIPGSSLVPAIPDEITHFGRKNHTGPEHDFQIKKKEKFSDPISLSPLSVTY